MIVLPPRANPPRARRLPMPRLQGPCLFDLLDNIEAAGRDPFAPFRMPIMDRYK